jgi:hypothetical protein
MDKNDFKSLVKQNIHDRVREGVKAVIEERRRYVEDLLRQAVLASSDPEVLFAYAQRTNDLELWEASIPVLERLKDPRLAVAKAMTRRLADELGL